MSKLYDLGERQLVDQVIRKHCSVAGDDCAFLHLPGSRLAITTDPVPEPAAFVLAGDPDPYWKGWLLVTINASDLAAAGADPLGFVASVEAPPDTSVEELDRLLQGIEDACVTEKIEYVGGNLREAKVFFGYRNSGRGRSIGRRPFEIRCPGRGFDIQHRPGRRFLERCPARTGWLQGRHTGFTTLSSRFAATSGGRIGPLRPYKGCY